ncbi:TetR/AcrR family transcriptional regulator [Rudaeicoccus suwonensis]|uniref:TetR/AcrR family transcriptional regulator n=1 Tax=Rudaeicoccus suwonensis TaxID=657409 RepID=UPI001476B5EC|nr:TetR/AcrR family transcriptional regulator [Rudaeicoccus suwonensis]
MPTTIDLRADDADLTELVMHASWSPKRLLTAHRITRAAQQLAVAKGYEHFTLDELAEAADVSRRTLFNYFDGKLDATLGVVPGLSQDDIDTFVGGGTGDLIDDLGSLVLGILNSTGVRMRREDWVTTRRCFETNPRLVIAAHERFSGLVDQIRVLVERRESLAPYSPEVPVLLAMLGGIFKVTLQHFIQHDDGREVGEIFLDNLLLARRLFTQSG